MYCSKCGKEVLDEAVICPNCGCMIKKGSIKTARNSSSGEIGTHTSAILGVIGIIFDWIFALIGHVVSITGIIYGVKEYKETEKTTGLILSIIGEIFSIISSAIGAVALSGLF